jgi:hypothetical protein
MTEAFTHIPFMKHLLLFLLLVTQNVSDAQQIIRRQIISASEISLEERLDGKMEWPMKNGETLHFSNADGITKLSSSSQTIVEIQKPEYVNAVVASLSSSCLLLLIMRERERGSDYSRLIRVIQNPQGSWGYDSLLLKDEPPMDQLNRWISELGTVSDSGKMALFKMGETNQETSEQRMRYVWQTWDLDARRKVADGIRIPEGFDK